MTQEPEWVEVASTGNDEEAALIAGLLKSEDIPCVVEAPSGGSPWPENLGAFGFSRVMVPPDRASEARELIARQKRRFQHESAGKGSESPDDESA
jgi:hypothetical protein